MKSGRVLFIATAALFFCYTVAAYAVVFHPPLPSHTPSYLELVRRKEICPEGDCFTEYVYLSNGIVVRKQFQTPDYEGRALFSMRRLTPSEVDILLISARRFIKEHASQKWSVDSDKIYLSDGGVIATYSSEATPEFTTLLDEAEKHFNRGSALPREDDFFLHSYYQLTGGDIADFHVFGDGTVVFSWFKRRSDEMKSSVLTTLDEKELPALRQMAKTAVEAGVAPVPYRECDAASGIDYALMEIRDGGDYVKSYLCPGDASPLMKTFEFLRSLQK